MMIADAVHRRKVHSNGSATVGDKTALDLLAETREAKQQAEARVKELKAQFAEILQLIANETPPENQQAVVNYLYWEVDELGCKDIDNMFYGVMHQPAQISLNCERCNQPLIVKTRTEFKELERAVRQLHRYPRRFICDHCEEADRAESSARYRAKTEAAKARLIELQTMPYAEYLQTPEWSERRTQALKSASWKCQLCNADGVALHVHHRTYERRGCEYAKDLIALCAPCHAKFHDKLPRP